MFQSLVDVPKTDQKSILPVRTRASRTCQRTISSDSAEDPVRFDDAIQIPPIPTPQEPGTNDIQQSADASVNEASSYGATIVSGKARRKMKTTTTTTTTTTITTDLEENIDLSSIETHSDPKINLHGRPKGNKEYFV